MDYCMKERAQSFGEVADNYGKFRPGPPGAYLEWLLPNKTKTVLDLGAGTGALTKTLLRRGHSVTSVEPDPRMRTVLSNECAGASVLSGTADNIPIPEKSVQAVLVSSAWHWMESGPAATEIGRVLASGGIFGIIWSQPDLNAPWVAEFDALVDRAHRAAFDGVKYDLRLPVADVDLGRRKNELERKHSVQLPPGSPFVGQEKAMFSWSLRLNSNGLLGLVGTSSRVITLPAEQRQQIMRQAASLIESIPGRGSDGSFVVPMISRCWRSRRTARVGDAKDRYFGGDS
jgi:SAM-dependent methyltransferase